jgi:lipid II:glycine glycyltransferase (peptidoglycan interpeptide bridge formation enzyme)
MIITREPFHGLDTLHVWWPEDPKNVYPLLSQAPVVMVHHCTDEVAAALKPYAFRTFERYPNLLMDLSLSEEELWRRVKREDRQDINKARRMGCQVLVNEETEIALQLINDSIRRKRFTRPIPLPEWRRMLEYSDVFLLKYEGRAIATRVVLVNAPVRVKALYSATMDRADARYRRVIGPLNRFLYWFEFTYYRARGAHWYDLGGADGDSIHQFKQSFGGQVVTENALELAANPVLRSMLRLMAGAKAILAPRTILPTIFAVPALRRRTPEWKRRNGDG